VVGARRKWPANASLGWICAPKCRPNADQRSAGRPNAGVDGYDQAIHLAEKAFHTDYTGDNGSGTRNRRKDMADKKKDEYKDDFVSALASDPGSIPETRMLVGYPGKGSSSKVVRIYTDATLDEYRELDRNDVLHSERHDERTFGPTFLWIRKDATETLTSRRRDASGASFLSGSMSDELMGRAVSSGFGRLDWISWTWTIATGLVCLTAKVSCICPTGGNCPTASGSSATSCCLCPAK
jgi:hypothetical protein